MSAFEAWLVVLQDAKSMRNNLTNINLEDQGCAHDYRGAGAKSQKRVVCQK